MSLISKVKLLAEMKDVLRLSDHDLQEFDMESLKKRIKDEKSDFIVKAFMLLAQKRNLLHETLWASNEFKKLSKNEDDRRVRETQALAIDTYVIAVNTNSVDLAYYENFVEDVLNGETIPHKAESRAVVLGSMSMGYHLRGQYEKSIIFMEKALENNPLQIKKEFEAVDHIVNKRSYLSWVEALRKMQHHIESGRPLREMSEYESMPVLSSRSEATSRRAP